MYTNIIRDEEGAKFVLLDDDKQVIYTSKPFATITECDDIIAKIKSNSSFVKSFSV